MLRAAFAAFQNGGGHRDFRAFTREAAGWLDDFALYRAIKRAHGDDAVDAVAGRRCAIATRARWPARARRSPTRSRSSASCSGASRATGAPLRDYAHARGVGLIGDIPIFVAHDSADVWQHRDLFHLDARRARRR